MTKMQPIVTDEAHKGNLRVLKMARIVLLNEWNRSLKLDKKLNL